MAKKLSVLQCKEGEIQIHCHYSDLLDPAGLIPHPDNNNLHTQEQVDIAKAVLKASGWRQPVVVSKETMRIVSGHLRVMTALEMGMDKVPVSLQSFPTRVDEVRHLTADNELARMAEFDSPKFIDAMKGFKKEMGKNEFQTTFFDPHAFGLTSFPKPEEDKEPKVKPAVPEIIKDGQVWLLGGHTFSVGEVAEFQQEGIQKFLKSWRKIQGAPAVLEGTGQTYDEFYDAQVNDEAN